MSTLGGAALGLEGLSKAGRVLRCICTLVTAALALAIIPTVPAQAALPDPAFRAFIEGLWPEAQAKGISRSTFDQALKGVEPDLTLPDLVLPGRPQSSSKGQAEFTRPPQDYMARGHMERLVTQGRALTQQHARTLSEVERKIRVDRNIVLAIWGRETAFGGHKLPHSAIRVLATQAYTGRRKELFRTELIFALRMLQDRLGTLETMRASWAGAMGLTQFMPSEFYSSAVDLDGDGRIDLFNSIPDALGSAAQQLKLKGWVPDLPWGFEVVTGTGVDCANDGPANERPISEWVKLGVKRPGGQPIPPVLFPQTAYLMSPGGAYGPQFLVTENFKVLRAYNTSDLYALFVGHLADRIAGGGEFHTPWGQIQQLGTKSIEEIQQRLKDRGYAIDKIDGKIGSNTRWQIGLYQRKSHLKVDCWPSDAVLTSLRLARTP